MESCKGKSENHELNITYAKMFVQVCSQPPAKGEIAKYKSQSGNHLVTHIPQKRTGHHYSGPKGDAEPVMKGYLHALLDSSGWLNLDSVQLSQWLFCFPLAIWLYWPDLRKVSFSPKHYPTVTAQTCCCSQKAVQLFTI